MVNDDFVSLYNYNSWADRRVLEACRTLTAEQYAAEPMPGWSSIRSSLVHIAVVTDGWLRALAGDVQGAVLTETELPTIDDIERLLDGAHEVFSRLIATLTPERLATPVLLQRGSRSATLPPWAVLRHVVNHATYHRGQVASKLKRFGIEPPVTDMIFWVFENLPRQA